MESRHQAGRKGYQYSLLLGIAIVLSAVILSPFLKTGIHTAPATISVLAFSIALPLLSITAIAAYRHERQVEGGMTPQVTLLMKLVAMLAIGSDILGFGAALWSLSWLVGSVGGAAALIALALIFLHLGHQRPQRP